jgi:hypothetical protein
MVNWGQVGAIAAVLALIEAPVIIVVSAGWRWVRSVDRRLAEIESRSHQRRHTDPPENDD